MESAPIPLTRDNGADDHIMVRAVTSRPSSAATQANPSDGGRGDGLDEFAVRIEIDVASHRPAPLLKPYENGIEVVVSP